MEEIHLCRAPRVSPELVAEALFQPSMCLQTDAQGQDLRDVRPTCGPIRTGETRLYERRWRTQGEERSHLLTNFLLNSSLNCL